MPYSVATAEPVYDSLADGLATVDVGTTTTVTMNTAKAVLDWKVWTLQKMRFCSS